jgi:RecB family exonuclease
MTQLLTNSRLSAFRKCPKFHELRYEIGLAPDEESEALRIGTAFHAAKEAADMGQDPEAAMAALGTLDAFELAMVAAMFTVHCERWAGDTLEVVASELSFELPVCNPDTGAATPIWRIAGKIDRIYRLPDGRLAVQDYKTTTEDLSPGSDYWLRLALDQQMSIYVLAARELGYDVQSILYDVTARPLQRPFKKTPDDKIKLKKNGEPYADTRLQDETPFEFTVRVAEAMRADPTRYFARHEIARTDRDLDECRGEVWSQQLAIREAQRSGRWFRNPGSCVTPYRCPYLPICHTQIRPDCAPSGFRILADVHPELARSEQAEQQPAATPPGV